MGLFDQQPTYEFIKTQPTNIGSVQHFSEITTGGGENSFNVGPDGAVRIRENGNVVIYLGP